MMATCKQSTKRYCCTDAVLATTVSHSLGRIQI